MGIYVNPGNVEFDRAIHDDIYIDKSDLIAYTNSRIGKSGRYLCVSRPRRFGKSMAADMLVAYYSKGCCSDDLFRSLNVARETSFQEHLNRHNVIRIDVQTFLLDREDLSIFINRIQRAIVRELIREFPDCGDLSPELRLQEALNEIYVQTGEGFIFIVDEWDCVFRTAKEEPEVQKRYLDFLRNIFKGAVYVELVYMTGILPVKKYGEHSAVNMFTEYSLTDPKNLGLYYGFTPEEVREQCEAYGISYELTEQWYDGYLIGESLHIYNPKSVVDALTWRKFQSYWTGTETYEALKIYIELDFDGLKETVVEMLGGAGCPVDPTMFQNDMTTFHSKDDVLTLLVHLGYLTYSVETGEVSIPNREVAQEFVRVIKSGEEWGNLIDSLRRSTETLESTWRQDGEAVASDLRQARLDTASIIKFNDENALSFAVYAAYSAAPAYYMKPIREFPSGRGFADIIYLPRKNSNKPALVIELKWDKTAVGALQQIKDKNYANWIREYTGDILLVGINYDKKRDMHECVIEKFEKR